MAFGLLLTSLARAQTGSGIFVVNDCSQIRNPVANLTYCLPATSPGLWIYNGATYNLSVTAPGGPASGDLCDNYPAPAVCTVLHGKTPLTSPIQSDVNWNNHNLTNVKDLTQTGGALALNGTSNNCTDKILGAGGVWQDTINPEACGVKTDLRTEPASATSGTTCVLHPGTPPTIDGCSTLNPTTADVNNLIRVVGLSNSNKSWQPNHAYAANYRIKPATTTPAVTNPLGLFYQTPSACTSGATEPSPWNQTIGAAQSDGTCIWNVRGIKDPILGINQFTGCVLSVSGGTITLGQLPTFWYPTTAYALNALIRPRNFINTGNYFYKATVGGTSGPVVGWLPNHNYATVNTILPNTSPNNPGNFAQRNTANCTSGPTEPIWNQTYGFGTSDNTCNWTNLGSKSVGGLSSGEPDWSNCQTQGCTTYDGTVTWTNVGRVIADAGACLNTATYTAPNSIPSVENVLVQTGSDDFPAWQKAIDVYGEDAVSGVGNPPVALLASNGLSGISATLLIRGKTGSLVGQGAIANDLDYSEPAGSGFVWFGARSQSMMRVLGDFNFGINKISFHGNSNPNNKPRACVTIAQPNNSGAVGLYQHSRFISAGNSFDNIGCNYGARLGSDLDTGGQMGNGLNLSTYGLEWSPEFNAQNERMHASQVYVARTDMAYAELMQQAVANEVDESSCFASAICFALPNGGDLSVLHPLMANEGLQFLVGGGGRLRVYNAENETDNLMSSQYYNHQMLRADSGGGQFVIIGGNLDYDWNAPTNGSIVDGNGTGVLPVYPGTGKTVVLGQTIQPPAQYPMWIKNLYYWRPQDTVTAWQPYAAYPPQYFILPINNNANANYFRQTDAGSTVGPGITGTAEPNWDTDCPLPGQICTEGTLPGVSWANMGPNMPGKTIVPDRDGNNPFGYAFSLKQAGYAGSVEPNWNSIAVGSDVQDGSAIWTNQGIYTTNTNLWVYRSSIPLWSANAAHNANITIQPTTTPNNPGKYYYKTGGACTSGASQPNPWNQTISGTQTDGTCTWTNLGATGPTTFTTGANMPLFSQVMNGNTEDGSVNWVTAVVGENTSQLRMTLSDLQFTFGGGGFTATQTPLMVFNQSGQSSVTPWYYFDCKNCPNLSIGNVAKPASTRISIISSDGGIGTTWLRTFHLWSDQNGASNDQGDDNFERLQAGQLPQPQRQHEVGLVNVRGHLETTQMIPPINNGPNCFLPVWAANSPSPINFVIRPGTTTNPAQYVYQNQGASLCNTGTVEPNWPSAGSPVSDGGCTWTKVGVAPLITTNAWSGSGTTYQPNTLRRPAVANNAGQYFVMVTSTNACIGGTTEPSWNQTVGGTTTDNACVWTTVGQAPQDYFTRFAVGVDTSGLELTTMAPTEQRSACGPNNAQNFTSAYLYNETVQPIGMDARWTYASLTTGTETLVSVTPYGADRLGIRARYNINKLTPPDWVVNTQFSGWDLLKPTCNNTNNSYFIAVGSGVTTGSCPNFNGAAQQGQTVVDNTSLTWRNVGSGAMPTTNTTGLILAKGATDNFGREQFKPGAGFQVGPGNVAPQTVIDESANFQSTTLAGSGVRCLHASSGGVVSPTSGDCGSAAGISVGVLNGGTGATNLSTSANNFFPINGQFAPNATESNVSLMAGFSGTVKNLNCSLSGTPTAGKTYQFIVEKNGTDTGQTCTIGDPGNPCADIVNTFTVVPTDTLSYKDVPTGTPTARLGRCSVQYTN